MITVPMKLSRLLTNTMKNSLTPQEEKLMYQVRDEWLSNIFEYKLKLDKKKAKKAINNLYKFSELKEPKFIIFVDSPLAIQYAVNMLKSGITLGGQVWGQVGDQVRGQVWDQVRGQVWDQVRGQVRDQVRGQVGGQVWGQVGDQVRGQVGDQVRDQVRGQVWDQVGDQVRDQVRGQVWGQKIEWFDFSYCGIGDWGWCSFYDFFNRIGILKNDGFEQYLEFLDAGIYDVVMLSNICVACPLPKKISRIEERGMMRLHSNNGMAIEWGDGYGQNYLYGVYFDQKLFDKVTSKKVRAKTILDIENIDQRMAALKNFGMEKLLETSNAELVKKSDRGNSLYRIPKGIFSVNAYFLKYVCPSTGRLYISGIDPKVGEEGDPDRAMAWKFSISDMDYKLLTLES